MSARTLGWAQRRLANAATPTVAVVAINADTGGLSGGTLTQAVDQVFEVTAGSSITITWGYSTGFTGNGNPADTISAYMTLFYETSTTAADGQTDSVQIVQTSGSAPVAVACHDHFTSTNAPNGVSQTKVFTPTHTGTVRLFVRAQAYVTATNTILEDINSDAGTQFGQHAETILATHVSLDFTPGLVRIGTAMSTIAMSGLTTNPTQGFFPDNATVTYTTAAAPLTADGTYSNAWQSASVTFATDTIAAGTSVTLTDSKIINPVNAFPASNASIGFLLTPASSTLSTALSGTGIPWIHFTTLPASWTGTTDTAGNFITVSRVSFFNADPRLQCHAHSAKSSTGWAHTPPDPGAPAPYDNFGDDTYLYIISADVINVWAAAFNMNALGINAITMTAHLADPTVASPGAGGGGDHTASLVTATTGGNPLGWSRQSLPAFASFPTAPSGQWHLWIEDATDGTNTWTRSNSYLVNAQGNRDPTGPFSTVASIEKFVSAYRDNLALLSFAAFNSGTNTVSKEASPGDSVVVGLQALNDPTGTGVFNPINVDSGTIPQIKVYRFNQATQLLEYVAGGVSTTVNMTQDPNDSTIWTFTVAFAATAPVNHYYAAMSAQVQGGDKWTQAVFIPLRPPFKVNPLQPDFSVTN